MPRPTLSRRAPQGAVPQKHLVLPFEARQKSRLLARLEDGTEVGVILQRGSILRGGDCLEDGDGRVVQVVAAPEPVSVVTATDPRQLARAAYHLGNRHVAVQLLPASLVYLHDHVLDDMVRGLGFAVQEAVLPFEPEGGAYSRELASALPHHHHHHGHDHAHTHRNGHTDD